MSSVLPQPTSSDVKTLTSPYPLRAIVLLGLFGGCAEIGRGDPLPDVADTRSDTSGDTRQDTGVPDGTQSDVPLDGDDGEEEVALPELSFADDGVHALLVANCSSGCHGSGAGGYTISGSTSADYSATLNMVTPGDGLASKLVKKATATSSHAGGPVIQVGSTEHQLLLDWIDSGANP